MLELQGIRGGYGRINVLDGITLAVGEGEFLGVLGHNGMGKTTLMRAIVGEVAVTAGTLAWRGGSLLGLYGYGASYAVASLSCTIAPFLAVTGLVSGNGGLVSGLAAFVAYGLGMGLIVGLLAMLVALAQETVVRRSRAVLPYVSRISGALLVLAGGYVAYYGWYELRVYAGGDADDPIVTAATELPGRVAGWVDGVGAGWITAALLLTVAGALLLRTRLRAR